MKTLADFKRKLTLGTTVRVTFLGGPLTIVGNVGTTVLPQAEPRVQTVSKVQSNSVAFTRADGRVSWLTWPKAKDFQVEDGKAVILNEKGQKHLVYEFI